MNVISDFEQNRLVASYLPRILRHMEQVIHDANLTMYDVSEIIPIGGSVIVSALQAYVFEHFHSAIRIRDSISPQSVIATGLAKVLDNCHDTVIGNYTTSILSLAIRTVGGVVTPVVHRISILPVEKSRVFTTVNDFQNCAILELYEGDRPTTRNNKFLARIEVAGIPPARRGIPKVCCILSSLFNSRRSHNSVTVYLAFIF
jgi:heat shock protein 5